MFYTNVYTAYWNIYINSLNSEDYYYNFTYVDFLTDTVFLHGIPLHFLERKRKTWLSTSDSLPRGQHYGNVSKFYLLVLVFYLVASLSYNILNYVYPVSSLVIKPILIVTSQSFIKYIANL